MAHVVLHVGLCSAVARLSPETSFGLHVRLIDRIGRPIVDKKFQVERGDDQEVLAEFDSPNGTYKLDLSAPQYNCNASDFLYFFADHSRSITEQLSNGKAPATAPLLLQGTAPQSFLYVQPTFSVFDKSIACKAPVGDPIPTNIRVENDQDSYYVWVYPDPSIPPNSQQLALRLRTPTNQHHYVRIPTPYPVPFLGWPSSITFNVTQDAIDDLATDPVDQLLCPRLFQTSAG